MTKRAISISAVLLLAALAAGPVTQPAAGPPKVGDRAVDFSLDTLDGKTVNLADLQKTGPVLVVALRGWVGYQCPICTRQVGELINSAKKFADAGAHVVLVYPGPADGLKDHAKDFISGKGLPDGFSFVIDPDMSLAKSWGILWTKAGETEYPSTFVVDTTGVVRYAKVSHTHAGRATAAEILKAIAAIK
jgi:peroxiredoxin Q/BCP